MDKYRAFELMENIDDEYLAEAEGKSSKKLRGGKMIAVAASAAVLLCGTVAAAAAGLGGLDRIGSFFGSVRSDNAAYSQLPALVNPADYATGLENDVHPLTGTAAFVSASVSDHFAYAMVEYGVEEDVLSALPEGETLSFNWQKCRSNLDATTAGCSPVSLDGNILTVMVYDGGAREIPDTMEYTLRDLGYFDSETNSFVTLKECEIDMTLEKSQVAVIEATKALNTSTLDGVEFSAEISPLGVLLTFDHDGWNARYSDPKAAITDKGIDINYMQFYLTDGTVIGDGESYDSVYSIFRSQGGWVSFDGSTEYRYYGFSSPIDVSTVDKITLSGMEFDF